MADARGIATDRERNMISNRCMAGAIRAFVWALLLANGTANADGLPDPGFGDGNQWLRERQQEFFASDANVGDVAVHADGRIVWAMENGVGGLWVARLMRNGDVDPTFGDDGLVTLSECIGAGPVRLVLTEPGGVVIWTGSCLLRLRDDGSIDPDFGAGAIGPTVTFRAAELLRDSLGRWLLAGTDGQSWRVHRFLAGGAIDGTFGLGGVATIDMPTSNGARTLHAVAISADQRIIVAGTRGNVHGTNLVIARLDANGANDSSFADDGLVDLLAPAGYSGIVGRALAIDRDGSILVGGEAVNGMQSCCVMVARFAADGTSPPSMMRIFPLGPNVSLSPFGETSMQLALLPNGKFLMARIAFPFQSSTRTRFTLVRMHADGLLDTGFNSVGWRSYVVNDPTGSGQSGPYSQLHGMAYANGEAVLFGRTFFEDNAIGADYLTLMRVRFDALFDDGFDLSAAER